MLSTTRRVEYLDISYTNVRDISAVGSLKRLRALHASDNEGLVNIDPLCGCTAMRCLELSNTGVDRVDAVGSMPWLHDLFLGGTPIGENSITAVYRCSHLQTLDVSRTVVRSLRIGDMPELGTLICHGGRKLEIK